MSPGSAKERAVDSAADRSFTVKNKLPYDADAATTGPLDHKRRLHGVWLIELSQIEPDPDQPRKRIDPTHLQELAASIRNLGILQPISVRFVAETRKYRIIAGECRYQAAKEASLTEIPCWVKTPQENQILLEQIVENWQRSDLNPFELADSLAILRDASRFTQEQLAAQTGKSPGEVSRLLSILDLPPDVQKLARDDRTGRVTKRHLFALTRFSADEQPKLLSRIVKDNLTALDLERLIARRKEQAERGDRRGAAIERRKFITRDATVVFTFRRKNVSTADLHAALREVDLQLKHTDSLEGRQG